ncbi:hypothetical protein DIURU_004965 [Diutina rugosa]|uniref:Protein kinase domain-containing protein n=1 Tax=Diutina rugosa TaxID=5481 RepID=A0A642UFS6_DIURU|nr:uncharacterized protein DIURU_004965 [Diutina rugosa]KAA8898110.1 hypothetical protein DIURU_004965 [Diutina rugosa]
MKDIELIEQQKENIAPLDSGRSVSKLVPHLRGSKSNNSDLQRQRDDFEQQLQDLTELDDPLQVFVDYLSWMRHSYSHSNASPELVMLLERATTRFKDDAHYRNDPRFVKICLEYCRLTDIPREMLIYMSKKGIGSDLAVFYEEFARHLEVQGQISEANEIYQRGLSLEARPKSRLERNWRQFRERVGNFKAPVVPKRRLSGETQVLSVPTPVSAKRSKMTIFQDEPDSVPSFVESITNGNDAPDPFSSAHLHERLKENHITPSQWVGETIKQKMPLNLSSRTKIPVYVDTQQPQRAMSSYVAHDYSIAHDEFDGGIITIYKVPGKHTERIHINTQLLKSGDMERCPLEVMMASTLMSVPKQDSPTECLRYEPSYVAPPSPTVTFHGRDSRQVVQRMFGVGVDLHDSFEEEVALRDANIPEQTENFTDYVTVTSMAAPVVEPADATIPTQEDYLRKQSTPSTAPASPRDSSPFTIETAQDAPKVQVFDIGDTTIRDNRLHKLQPSNLEGFHDRSSVANGKVAKYQAAFKLGQPKPASSAALIDFCGNDLYVIKSELGEGGYGTVYLVESAIGEFKALKAETPASKWEFYIMKELEKRSASSSYFVKPYELYYFADESWLLMQYCPQFSLLDLVNLSRETTGKSLSEPVCALIAIELLRAVKLLHQSHILHADIKPDNVMTRVSSSEMSIVLIDYGRALDLSLYPEGAQFLSHIVSNGSECLAMQRQQSWGYDADYFGVAAVIYCVLYSEFMKVSDFDGEVKLASPLKRWHQDLWGPLFKSLLNPYKQHEPQMPLTTIDFHIKRLEAWVSHRREEIKANLESLKCDLAKKRRNHENR